MHVQRMDNSVYDCGYFSFYLEERAHQKSPDVFPVDSIFI